MIARQEDATKRELARGTVELAVLALLGSGPRYGYELMSLYEEATGGAAELKEGTLYPLLHRLEDGGYVSTSWEAEGRNAPRKYYSLTKAGAARLDTLADAWKTLVDGMERLLGGEGR